jgi:nitrile hydratase
MSSRFAPGDRVRVRAVFPPGHVRTPYYIRGKAGVIERVLDAFANPELAAYGHDGPKQRLYRVRFRQTEVWPDYAGPDSDTLDVEIYEHWLEPG